MGRSCDRMKYLDVFFPSTGPCAFCGDERVGARHRVMDSIAGAIHTGDPVQTVAKDFGVSDEAALFALGFEEGWALRGRRRRKAQ